MTYLILSDSHGRVDNITEAIRRTRPDGILFAGDGLRDLASLPHPLPCPLWAVRGNCDAFTLPLIRDGVADETREEERLTLEGVGILLMHGHRYGVKHSLTHAITHAAAMEADILLFGHTHIPEEHHLLPGGGGDLYDGADLIPLQKPLTIFNPGSIGDARHPTFGTLTIRDGIPLLGHGQL